MTISGDDPAQTTSGHGTILRLLSTRVRDHPHRIRHWVTPAGIQALRNTRKQLDFHFPKKKMRVILCLNVSLSPHPLHHTTGLLEIEILLNQLHAARRQNILLLIQNNYFSFALSFILKLSLRGLDTPGLEYSVILCLRCLRRFYRGHNSKRVNGRKHLLGDWGGPPTL